MDTQKKINVIAVDKKGSKTNVQMSIRNFLQSKAILPDRYLAADKEGEKILEAIPLHLVPKGTTQKDVDEFWKNLNSKKGKTLSTFETLLKNIEQGNDVSDDDVAESIKIPSEELERDTPIESEEAPKDFSKIENKVSELSGGDVTGRVNDTKDEEEDELKEIKDEFETPIQKKNDGFTYYDKSELEQLTIDKLHGYIENLPKLPESAKENLKKVSPKKEMIKQVLDVTPNKGNK